MLNNNILGMKFKLKSKQGNKTENKTNAISMDINEEIITTHSRFGV